MLSAGGGAMLYLMSLFQVNSCVLVIIYNNIMIGAVFGCYWISSDFGRSRYDTTYTRKHV